MEVQEAIANHFMCFDKASPSVTQLTAVQAWSIGNTGKAGF